MKEQTKVYKGIITDNGEHLSVRGKLFEGKEIGRAHV